MQNVYESVDANKRKSWLVIIFFNLFIIGGIYLILNLFDYGVYSLILAGIVATFSTLINYYKGDQLVILSFRAKPIDPNRYPTVVQAVDNIAIATGMPKPKVYIIPSAGLNAMATGRDPQHASVLVTEGLAQSLNKSELEAVIGHEFGHIVNYDIRLMTFISISIGIFTLFLNFVTRSYLYGGRRNDNNRETNAILQIIGIAFIVLAPIIAQLLQLAVSRSREYLADSFSAKVTKQPQSLINALIKISQMPTVKQASLNTAHFFIASPFAGKSNFIMKLFATHPPVEDRIKALEAMIY